MMTFEQAQAYVNATIDERASRRMPNRLDRMRALLRELGQPHEAYPTFHVGGTSGKGSTSTMIASVLSASGKRTGLHAKPHLRSMTERARIDGIPVAEDRFAGLIEEMMPAIERVTGEHGRPTYYETLLALAFTHFATERVDAAVIEVGIGGTLDGTNVIVPRVAAITSVGYDHTEILGNTLEAIAADKAGIAKPGVPLVCAARDGGARAVIERHARDAGAPFVHVDDAARVRERTPTAYGERVIIDTECDRYTADIPLLGEFQARNAATAIAVLERAGDLRPSREAVERGLAHLVLPGRMEFVPGHPSVVFDIAHNPEKAANLAAALRERFGDRRLHYVVAIGESKDAREILRAFTRLPASFTFTAFSLPGKTAVPAPRLASLAEEFGAWGRAISDPVDAFSLARRTCAPDEIVVVTGSTFVVALVREWYCENVGVLAGAR